MPTVMALEKMVFLAAADREEESRMCQKSNTRTSMSKGTSIVAVLLVVFASILFVSQSGRHLGFHDQSTIMAASSSPNPTEIQELARFAVQEHNHKENGALELVRVAKAEEQVVAGTLHHLTLEVIEGGKKVMYQAKVWVKPWMDFKQLEEFKYVGDAASFTPSDLGAKTGAYGFGWKSVPVDDPSVQDAANHALNTIQQRSNSLVPYQLHQILEAKAEVSEECAKFDMVVKLKRGEKEEKMRVEVHKDEEGHLHLNKMEPDRT